MAEYMMAGLGEMAGCPTLPGCPPCGAGGLGLDPGEVRRREVARRAERSYFSYLPRGEPLTRHMEKYGWPFIVITPTSVFDNMDLSGPGRLPLPRGTVIWTTSRHQHPGDPISSGSYQIHYVGEVGRGFSTSGWVPGSALQLASWLYPWQSGQHLPHGAGGLGSIEQERARRSAAYAESGTVYEIRPGRSPYFPGWGVAFFEAELPEWSRRDPRGILYLGGLWGRKTSGFPFGTHVTLRPGARGVPGFIPVTVSYHGLLASGYLHVNEVHLIPLSTAVAGLGDADAAPDSPIDTSTINWGKVALWGAIAIGVYLVAKSAKLIANRRRNRRRRRNAPFALKAVFPTVGAARTAYGSIGGGGYKSLVDLNRRKGRSGRYSTRKIIEQHKLAAGSF